MHGMHLGSLNSVVASGESSEPEAGFSEVVAAPEEFILEAVFDPSDLNQGKPRCITHFILSPLYMCYVCALELRVE